MTPQRGPTIGADAAVALAQKALPGGTLRNVALPARRTQAISVSLFGSWGGNANVWIDPWRGTVLAVNDPLAKGDIMAWQRPLHQGAGLGAIWRILVFLVGFLPALFVVTGITMWLKKRQQRISMSAPLVAGDGAMTMPLSNQAFDVASAHPLALYRPAEKRDRAAPSPSRSRQRSMSRWRWD